TWASHSRCPDPATHKRPGRRPRSVGKKLTAAAEAVAKGRPEEGGGTVGAGRGPVGTEADRPARLVAQGPAPALVWPDPVPVAVPLRVRAPQDRRHLRRVAAARQSRAHVRGAGRVRASRGPGGEQGALGAFGQ